MSITRKLVKIYTPPGQPGFLGAGHIARPVINGSFSDSDPFIILMDDMLDKKDNEPVGGPHPHAGFETVSLLLEGEMGDEPHKMKSGDLQIMTAGSGVVHTETIEKKARMRLLQLWLNLPKKERAAAPRLQHLSFEDAPALSENGVAIKLYSGSLAGLTSPIQNYTPLILADITMEAGVGTVLQIPANYNTFLYVLSDEVEVGVDRKLLSINQAGWLDLYDEAVPAGLQLNAGEKGTLFILYAGKPTGDNIVSHGPFIADSSEDIQRLYREYRQGKMKHISTIAEDGNL
jgi:redox-sensitive bicupin YhaK (pirin superfamily)